MFGIKSVGGSDYNLAKKREASFIAVVWITGFIKIGGGLFLLLLLK
ncbi:hypothetical protein [Alkalihalobacillus sp. TS-13]|nr:hypothetical protein [Alkalihalobacillus sp. TS-13]